MLDLMCQAAVLCGQISGDNMADNVVLSEEEVQTMQSDAHTLGECIQVLHGTWNTSKLYRLMLHLGEELRTRGNFWESDTSLK